MAYRNTSLNDVFSSVGKAAVAANSVLDHSLTELANAEYQNNKINLDNYINDKMREYSQRTDFENFESDFTESLQRFKDDKGQAKTIYSQKLINDYYKSAESSAMNSIKDLVLKGQQNYTATLNQKTLEALSTQPVSQDRLNQQLNIVRNEYDSGRLSAQQWANQSQALAVQAQTEEALKYYNEIIKANPYASDDQIEKLMDKFTSQLDTGAYTADGEKIKDENGNDINHVSSISTAAKAAKDTKWAEIKQTRENNNTRILEQNTGLMNDYYLGNVSEQQAIANIERQILTIDQIANTNLSAEQKRSRTSELYTYLNHLKAASTGSTAAKSALNYNSLINDLKALKTDLMYTAQTQKDTSIYNAKDAFEKACNDKFYALANANKDYYTESGRTPQEDYALFIEPLINSWISDAVKGGYIPEGAGSLIDKAAKDIKNLTKDGYQDYSEDYTNFIYDTLFGMDYTTAFNGDMNKITEFINGKSQQYKDAIVAKKIDALLDPQNKKYQNANILTLDEKDLLTYVKGQSDSIVYTYGDSTKENIKVSGKSAQAIAGKGADMMERDLMHVIAGTAGANVNNAKITRGYQPTEDGYDVEGTLNFTISDTGNKELDGYTFRYTTDEKNKNIVLQKKPANYTWEQAEKTGQLKTVNRNSYDKEEKALKKAQEEKTKQTQKETKAAYEAAKANEPKTPDVYDQFRPEGMTDHDWELVKKDYTQLSKYVNRALNGGK